MKKIKLTILCVFLVVTMMLLGGCLKMHIDVVWNADNSGTISTTVGAKKSMASMMGGTEKDLQNSLRDGFVENEAEFKSIETFSDDEYTGIIAVMEVDDITKDETGAADQLRFRSEGEGKNRVYTVTGSFDSSDSFGDAGEMESMGVSMEDIDMKLSITMPGKITSHNATEQNGNKLTWNLAGSSVVRVEAESKAGGAGGLMNIIMWVVFVLSLLVLIAIVLLIILRKKPATSPAYDYAPPPQQFTPPAYDYTPPPQQFTPPAYEYAPPPQQAAPPAYDYAPSPQQAAPPVYEQSPPPQQPAPPVYEQSPPPQQPAPPVYEQTPPPPPGMIQCSQCGAQLQADARFCTECGNSIGN